MIWAIIALCLIAAAAFNLWRYTRAPQWRYLIFACVCVIGASLALAVTP